MPSSQLLSYLSADKQQRLDAFINPSGRKQFLLSDLLVQAIACRHLNLRHWELDFAIDPYGKPYLCRHEDFCFNLSHSGRWAVCAVDREPVGVDIERISAIEEDIAGHYFTRGEIAYIMDKPDGGRTAAFYDIWTLKESCLKALGCGLSRDLQSFTVAAGGSLLSELPGSPAAFLRQYEIDPEYRLSVCAFNSDFPDRVQIVDLQWILEALD